MIVGNIQAQDRRRLRGGGGRRGGGGGPAIRGREAACNGEYGLARGCGEVEGTMRRKKERVTELLVFQYCLRESRSKFQQFICHFHEPILQSLITSVCVNMWI